MHNGRARPRFQHFVATPWTVDELLNQADRFWYGIAFVSQKPVQAATGAQ
jgi:hypothetical protein